MDTLELEHGAARARDAAVVPGRMALGATMLYHGLEKLRRERRDEVTKMFASLGLRPARFWSLATAVAEFGAGVLTLGGILTRPAALAVVVTQTVAVAKVHASKGFPVTRGGYEFNLALMALAAAMLIAGPGRYSLHGALRRAVVRRPSWIARLAGSRRRRLGARAVDLLL
jgi:putative oxidoreductase